MEPREAVLSVLDEADEPLHWTVVQDRALRTGRLDPFELGDVRRAVLSALAVLTREGLVHRDAKGVYSRMDAAP
jgi:hypothetical protein